MGTILNKAEKDEGDYKSGEIAPYSRLKLGLESGLELELELGLGLRF
jgi:hypothetical protein